MGIRIQSSRHRHPEEQPNSALIHGLKLEVKRLQAENKSMRKELARAYARRLVNCQQEAS